MISHPSWIARSLLTTLLFTGLAVTTPARAQLIQVSLSLNETSLDSEYLSVSDKSGLEGNDSYTIEAWVHPTALGTYGTIVGNDYHSSFWLGLSPTGIVRFYPRGLGLGGFVESISAAPLNAWTHVAATYHSATGWAIYLNGFIDASGAGILGSVGTSPGELRIGADYESGSPDYFFRGYLDEIRIWNVQRTMGEIQETMHTAVGRPSSFASGVYDALVANWTSEGPFVTGITDYTFPTNFADFENGDYTTHTTLGDPFGPPIAPNVALSLNGSDDHAVMPVTENFGGGLTVMGWVAPTNFVGFPTVAGRNYATSFWLGFSTTGQLRFYPTGGPFNYVESPQPIMAGKWTHVAATYSDGHTVLYVNGRVVLVSATISGPVGANGEDVWVGADREGAFLDYAFLGLLDEVKVVQGVLDNDGVRTQMFLGHPAFVNPVNVLDQDGAIVSMYHASFDRLDPTMVEGTNARLVRGGTAAFRPGMAALTSHPVWNFQNHILGGVSALPEDNGSGFIGTDLYWPLAAVVNDVDVFLSAPVTNLATTQIHLRSPMGTSIELLTAGDAVGRDLLTIFDDAAAESWSTGANPFHEGVRPSQPLATFNGEPSLGFWRIELFSGPSRVGLWAWGLRINHQTVSVDPPGLQSAGLRLEGANPVQGGGTLAFDLTAAARVQLGLFDIQGRRVRTLLSGLQSPGSFRMHFNAAALQPGIYFARLLVDGEARGEVRVSVVH